jgi:hypothetical protein
MIKAATPIVIPIIETIEITDTKDFFSPLLKYLFAIKNSNFI